MFQVDSAEIAGHAQIHQDVLDNGNQLAAAGEPNQEHTIGSGGMGRAEIWVWSSAPIPDARSVQAALLSAIHVMYCAA